MFSQPAAPDLNLGPFTNGSHSYHEKNILEPKPLLDNWLVNTGVSKDSCTRRIHIPLTKKDYQDRNKTVRKRSSTANVPSECVLGCR